MSFVAVVSLDALPEGKPYAAEVAGERLVLVRQGAQVFALADRCSHEDARLSEGYCEGERIECPRHGATFDLRTGRALTLPATEGVWTYPVRVVAGQVEVALAEREEAGAA